jgi:hypothetical protein
MFCLVSFLRGDGFAVSSVIIPPQQDKPDNTRDNAGYKNPDDAENALYFFKHYSRLVPR